MAIILILGSTTAIGKKVARRLLQPQLQPQHLLQPHLQSREKHTIRCGVDDVEAFDAQELTKLGAECVKFDSDDKSTWTAAFHGVERMFVLLPIFFMSPTLNWCIRAAKEAGVKSVVHLCSASACCYASTGIPVEGTLVASVGFEHYTAIVPNPNMRGFTECECRERQSKRQRRSASSSNSNTTAAEASRDKMEQQHHHHQQQNQQHQHHLDDCGVDRGAIRYVVGAGTDVDAMCVSVLLEPAIHNGTSYVVTEGTKPAGADVARLLSARCCPHPRALGRATANAYVTKTNNCRRRFGTGGVRGRPLSLR